MLLLVTIGLVLVGAVSLVVGVVGGGSQTWIYLSLACSAGAAVALSVFSRMSRRAAAGEPASAPSGFSAAETEDRGFAESDETVAVAAVGSDDDGFPIDDYDNLLVSEILPVLPELDLDELEQVREREEAGKNRSSVMKRIDQLIDQMEEAEEQLPVTAAVPAVGDDDDFDDEEEEEEEEGEEDEDDGDNPIPGYSRLSVAQIIPLLDDLSDEDLDAVALYEEQHQNRRQIIDHIDSMFEEVPVDEPEPAPKKAAPKKAAPKKAAAKKAAPAKSAATKKTPAKKAAAAKKTPAKKAAASGAKKAAASGAKKAAAKKATKATKATKKR